MGRASKLRNLMRRTEWPSTLVRRGQLADLSLNQQPGHQNGEAKARFRCETPSGCECCAWARQANLSEFSQRSDVHFPGQSSVQNEKDACARLARCVLQAHNSFDLFMILKNPERL